MVSDGPGLAPNSSLAKLASKLRCGELEEDDIEEIDFLLPAKQIIGPDKNRIKKIIEYKFNNDGTGLR